MRYNPLICSAEVPDFEPGQPETAIHGMDLSLSRPEANWWSPKQPLPERLFPILFEVDFKNLGTVVANIQIRESLSGPIFTFPQPHLASPD